MHIEKDQVEKAKKKNFRKKYVKIKKKHGWKARRKKGERNEN
jgi:hypothetical protein